MRDSERRGKTSWEALCTREKTRKDRDSEGKMDLSAGRAQKGLEKWAALG